MCVNDIDVVIVDDLLHEAHSPGILAALEAIQGVNHRPAASQFGRKIRLRCHGHDHILDLVRTRVIYDVVEVVVRPSEGCELHHGQGPGLFDSLRADFRLAFGKR